MEWFSWLGYYHTYVGGARNLVLGGRMRVFFGVLGALIGVGLGVWYLGEVVGGWIVEQQTLQSPDDARLRRRARLSRDDLPSLVVGWFFGWWFGGLFAKPER